MILKGFAVDYGSDVVNPTDKYPNGVYIYSCN